MFTCTGRRGYRPCFRSCLFLPQRLRTRDGTGGQKQQGRNGVASLVFHVVGRDTAKDWQDSGFGEGDGIDVPMGWCGRWLGCWLLGS
jgi:hypothetical protein